MKRIVALASNSLLVQGLVSRLREYSHVFEVRMVDLAAPDPLQQVSAFQPDIIIFDGGDLKATTCPSLIDFLNSLPEVILLELRLDNPHVQLIQSVLFKATTTDDLVQMLNTSGHISRPANVS